MRRHKQHGFSLVELMTVIVILVVLGAIAYPAISALIPGFRLRAAGQEVYRALQAARIEAIKRNKRVTVEFESENCDNVKPWVGLAYSLRVGDDPPFIRGTLPPLVAVCDDSTLKNQGGPVKASFNARGLPYSPRFGTVRLLNSKKRELKATLAESGAVKIVK